MLFIIDRARDPIIKGELCWESLMGGICERINRLIVGCSDMKWPERDQNTMAFSHEQNWICYVFKDIFGLDSVNT